MMTMRWCGVMPLTVGVLAVLAGCDLGPSSATGSGRVLYKGIALSTGEVNFFSAEKGIGGVAKIDGSGEFKLPDGLAPGRYAVYVTPPLPAPQPPGTPPAKAAPVNIPLRARDPATSGVVVALAGGGNEVVVELQD